MSNPKPHYYFVSEKLLCPGAVRSSWEYDGRFAASCDRKPDTMLVNQSEESAQSVCRLFEEQKGSFTMLCRILIGHADEAEKEKPVDGTYVSIGDDDGNTPFLLETKNGMFVYGKKELAPATVGNHTLRLDVDMQQGKVIITLDGVATKALSLLTKDKMVSRVTFGLTKGHKSRIFPKILLMYTGFAVHEEFTLSSLGKMPSDWKSSGSIAIGDDTFKHTDATLTPKAGEEAYAVKRFESEYGVTCFETDILLPDGADGAYVELLAGSKCVLKISTKGGYFVNKAGKKLMKFTPNVWQYLRIEADPNKGNAFVRIDTKKVGTIKFDTKTDFFDGIRIGFKPDKDTVMYFNYVYVYNYDLPNDYVPVPKPIDTGDYVVGMNVCNLWREGSHFGWDHISPFSDLEPLLGYYEEAVPETADWEIKFLVEHGIKFQHPCWYCPQWSISAPVRGGNEALNRGLLVSRYADMMKFIFMWENTSGQIDNFEQFRDYIWPYWKEYYFSNPNYLVMDNKPVMTCYLISLFVQKFGGMENAIQAMKFMKEDIKTLGFDGLIFIFHDLHDRSMKVFGPIVEVGSDGIYGYHWNNLGKDPKHQMNRMRTNRSFGMYVVPVIGVGFNNIGWAHHRERLITLGDHEKVPEYIKNELIPQYKDDEPYKSKLIMCATWNEYGEGHYMMPSKLHGFGYLETIKKAFSDAPMDHEEDVIPTEAQKARITHLYRQNRSKIRPLRWLDESKKHIPTKVIKAWDFTDKKDAAKWKPSDDILEWDIENGKMHGRRDGGTGDIAVTFGSKLAIDLDKVDVFHIRMRSVDECNYCYVSYGLEGDEKGGSIPMQYMAYNPSEEYMDFYVPKAVFSKRTGIINSLELSPMRLGWGTFDIECVEFLAYTEKDRPSDVYVDGVKLQFEYEPENRDGDLYVTLNPDKNIFNALNLIYQISRKDATLRIQSVNKDMRFTVGDDFFLCNGRMYNLPCAYELKDGLPVFPITFFAEFLGYTVDKKGKDYYITTKL